METGLFDLFAMAPVAGFIFVVTLFTSLFDFATGRRVRNDFMLVPYLMRSPRSWYRVITSGLVHANGLHLFFNLYVFFFFCFYLEGATTEGGEPLLLGSGFKFGVVYLASLVGGALPALVRERNNPQYAALGASGAISGAVFSFILFVPTAQFIVFFVLPMPAWLFGVVYLVFSAWAAQRARDNIAHDAHFWGAVAGMLTTIAIEPRAVQQFSAFLNLLTF